MSKKPQGMFVQGPAGSAKTGFMLQNIAHKIRKRELASKDVLILTYSVIKAEEIRSRLKLVDAERKLENFQNIQVINIHKQAHQDMKELKGYQFGQHNRQHQDLLRLANPKKQQKYQQLDKNREFDCLIQDYGDLLELYNSGIMGQFKLIAVDELQILNINQLRVLVGILKHAGLPEIIIAGDSNQDLFHWQKKTGVDPDSFEILQSVLEDHYELKKTRQLKYRRGTAELAKFYQGFEEIVNSKVSVKHSHNLEVGIMPKIILVPDKKAQTQRLDQVVSDIRLNYPNENLMVVGRHNWAIKPYKECADYNAVTIHSALGSDADHVVWADMSNMDAKEHLEAIIRVAISRPKKSLTIISTDSQDKVCQWFKPGTYHLENLQKSRAISQTRNNLKAVKKNRNKSLRKLKSLDSLEIAVPHAAVQYNPQLMRTTKQLWRSRTTEERYWQTLKLAENTTRKNLPTYSITRYMLKDGLCSYRFIFKSLGFLSANGFDEQDILIACRNEIIRFFEGRIQTSYISVPSIDLAGYYLCTEEQKSFMRDRLFDIGKNFGKYRQRSVFVYDEDGGKSRERVERPQTIYINNGSKAAGVTICAYDPSKKTQKHESLMVENANNRLAHKPYSRDDLFKIEIRTHGLKTVKKWFGSNSLDEIIRNADALPENYQKLAKGLGITEQNHVLGLEYTQESWGVFRVKNKGEIQDIAGGIGVDFRSDTPKVTNKIKDLVSSCENSRVPVYSSSGVHDSGILYYTESGVSLLSKPGEESEISGALGNHDLTGGHGFCPASDESTDTMLLKSRPIFDGS